MIWESLQMRPHDDKSDGNPTMLRHQEAVVTRDRDDSVAPSGPTNPEGE
jgi:hypothetical protein